MNAVLRTTIAIGIILMVQAGAGRATGQEPSIPPVDGERGAGCPREEPFVRRPFRPFNADRWIGDGIAYGPHRDGQHPGGPTPSESELRQDLRIISRHWSLLRVYGAREASPSILKVIREEGLDIKVMLGVWIEAEERLDEGGLVLEVFPEKRAANRGEIESAIRLAAEYPGIIVSLCVGNETQVFWSGHRCPPELLIDAVREVRTRTTVPVTVADDYNFWNKPESAVVAREIDFLTTHLHPMWNGIQSSDALGWVQKTLEDLQRVHPNHTLVIGETGWATRKHSEGEQARLIQGIPGEDQQKDFYEALTGWVRSARIPTFFFEAFDENWKGGDHPDEVEKHWGLFRTDRTPKKALFDER